MIIPNFFVSKTLSNYTENIIEADRGQSKNPYPKGIRKIEQF
jgi:hypothetical protein